MRVLAVLVNSVTLIGRAKASSDTVSSCKNMKPPFVGPKTLVNGIVKEIEIKDTSKLSKVYGCCSKRRNELVKEVIGYMPEFSTNEALDVLESSIRAWDGGVGRWPQMAMKERIAAIGNAFEMLKEKREDIVSVLMWEIGKNRIDAESEFDRTVEFVEHLMDMMLNEGNMDYNSKWNEPIGSTNAFIRRAAIGIIMCLGPFNYPLNETYSTLIPALLMGNVLILKIPTIGGLVHLLTMQAFSKALPPGTINFISGSGRTTMPPLMKTGNIDGLAFIGGSNAADQLIKNHPNPHRLKLFLQLEAKNLAIFLPDVFHNTKMLDNAIDQAVLGSLSYNGQRCTALKLLFIPKQHIHTFLPKFLAKVEQLTVGLPWQTHNHKYSQITPLPTKSRIIYMQDLISDALAKGANIINKNGSEIIGQEEQSTLMVPAVIYPVTKEMKLYHEEQFGPVVPIVTYEDINQVIEYAKESKYAQQCSIFTSSTTTSSQQSTSRLIDTFSNIFGKINLNSQCGRSPDTLPFSGRRSSAMGTMSIIDSLREFSVPTVVSYKTNSFVADGNVREADIVKGIQDYSLFMQ